MRLLAATLMTIALAALVLVAAESRMPGTARRSSASSATATPPAAPNPSTATPSAAWQSLAWGQATTQAMIRALWPTPTPTPGPTATPIDWCTLTPEPGRTCRWPATRRLGPQTPVPTQPPPPSCPTYPGDLCVWPTMAPASGEARTG